MSSQDILNTVLLLYFLPIFVSVITLIVAISIKFMLASYFCEIACDKGYGEKRYFWVPFFFGIIGYIMVAALPDRGIKYQLSPSPAHMPAETDD